MKFCQTSGQSINSLFDKSNLLAMTYVPVPQQHTASLPGEAKGEMKHETFTGTLLFGAKKRRQTVPSKIRAELERGVKAGHIEPIYIQGTSGNLSGFYHSATSGSSTQKVVLFLSGSGLTSEEISAPAAKKYTQNGVDMLTVNYRGFGKSAGIPSEQGLYSDAQAMLSHLVHERNVAPENIIIHGYSLGGPVAAHLATYADNNGLEIGGLLLDRPIPSVVEAAIAHAESFGKISGKLGKKLGKKIQKFQGSMSVYNNMKNLSHEVPLLMITDCQRLGAWGELLRTDLMNRGFSANGPRSSAKHLDSTSVMNQHFDEIANTFFEPASGDMNFDPGQIGSSNAHRYLAVN